MASKTITNAQRETAVAAAVAKTFGPRIAALEQRRLMLGDWLYDLTYGETEPLAQRLPKGWCDEASSIYAYDKTWGVLPDYEATRQKQEKGMATAPSCEFPLSRARLFPRNKSAFESQQVSARKTVSKEVTALVRDWGVCAEDRLTLRRALTQLLGSVRTFKQLETVWPEGREFWPKPAAVTTSGELAPADLIANVNKALGLAAAA